MLPSLAGCCLVALGRAPKLQLFGGLPVRFTFRLLPRNAAACALFAVALLTAYSQDAPTQETHGTVVANMDRSVKRLSPKQRSLLELLQYLVFMPEVHMRAALADSFSLDGFQTAWQAGEATAKAMNLAQITEAIGRQRALIEELLSPAPTPIFARKSKCSGTRPAAGRGWFCSCCLITPPIACSCSCI